MQVLSGLSLKEIEDFIASLNASKYRAKQIHNWIYSKSVNSIEEMTDLSKSFREELKKIATVSNSKIKIKQESKDGTLKYLVEYPDGECVETVLMRFDNRANLTACVSSQVGCAVNCSFCATGKRGFIRNLTYQEIVEQVLTIQRDTGLKVTNIVFMGQGEPLLNLENVLKALEIFNNDFQIGARRITISTSGIIPKIYELAELELQSTLAISLHSPIHEQRAKLMPIENKYPLNELKKALKYYIEKTGRRITIEYILIHEFNDTLEVAKKLAEFMKDLKCNVNLIPYNTVGESIYKKPNNNDIMKFKYIIEHSGKKVTVRLERGADIDAACGQLSGKTKKIRQFSLWE
ncbi:MAG: 23S rRNA (adenine(2503)-C(2))-methyltransferase RlmN [bacterium]|nr:23S rRNA (adenine(2503)-C(2))-methyltransferase RlmN [bacterium]